MDKQDMKPGLCLGYGPGQRGGQGGGSLQLGVNQESGSIHMTMPEGTSGQNIMQLSSMHAHGHSEGLLISPIAQPASQNSLPLQLLNHDSSMNSSGDGSLQSPSVVGKHGFSPLGNGGGPALKKRKESNFRAGGGDSSFRSTASHLQNSCATPPMSPRRMMVPQVTSQGAFQSVQPMSQMTSDGQAPQMAFKKVMPALQGSQQASGLQSLAQASFHLEHPLSNGHLTHRESRRLPVRTWGNQPLSAVDPDLWDLMEKEKNRQWRGIELIASENFVSEAVKEALGSHLTNKYSEGMPFARYYGGNEHIDQIETLCCERALEAFHLDKDKWGVNVQPYSCTSANFAVYTALLQPKDRIMGLDSRSGGHLSHGYYTSSGRKVSVASNFFESFPYKVHPGTGYIDYDKLEEKAMDYRPKILICGGSAYPRDWDFARFRQIADKCGAVLMCDMAHISGLVATQECNNPFEHCDVVTSTTHKILRGPRAGIIFYRKGKRPRRRAYSLYGGDEPPQFDYEDKINFAVFPQLQGGPHNNVIAALAVALLQVKGPEYKAYIQQVKKNAARLAEELMRRGCRLVTDGTDNHLILWDLRRFGLTGNLYEKVCEACNLTLNKNAVFGDSGAFAPGGVRLGTPAMTSRGCVEEDFEEIAEFLYRAAQISHSILTEHGKLQKDFMKGLENNKDIEDLKQAVENFARNLEMPGFDLSTMKYRH